MTIKLVPATHFDIETLTSTFNDAYEGYMMPVNVPPQWMKRNIVKNDLNLDLSLVAVQDDATVGICLVGQRGNLGWIGGVGVALPHRRQGIGWQLMEGALKNARAANLSAVDLEVIIGNDGAYAMYQRLGFETTAKLLILTREPSPLSDSLTLQGITITTLPFDDTIPYYEAFHATENPWQRQKPSLIADSAHFTNFVALQDSAPVAYLIARITDSAIMMMDAGFEESNDQAMFTLLNSLHSDHAEKTIRVINISEKAPVTHLLLQTDYIETMAQHAMRIIL